MMVTDGSQRDNCDWTRRGSRRCSSLQVSEEVHRATMANACTSWSEDAEVIIHKKIEGETDLELKEYETFLPPAPEGNETLLRGILDKWSDFESFTSFVDGHQTTRTNTIVWPFQYHTCWEWDQ